MALEVELAVCQKRVPRMISLTAHHLNFNLKIIRTEKLGFISGDIIIKELLVLISKEFRFP